MSTPMAHDAVREARITISRRRRERARHRQRLYTPNQKRLKRLYARRVRRERTVETKAKKLLSADVERGEKWLRGARIPKRLGGNIDIRPVACPFCLRVPASEPVQGHHFAGYETPAGARPPRVWACRQCHSAIHARMREAALVGHDPNDGFREFVLLMRQWAAEDVTHFPESPGLPAEYNRYSVADSVLLECRKRRK